MRTTSFINNGKCIEWGLNMQQGALFDLLNQLATWAEPVSINGEVYYWASRKMICDEIPLAYTKPDTVYRALKLLEEKGLIKYTKYGDKDCVSLTTKGKEWNSEINPRVGNKSEQTRKYIRESSEINPTYKNTKINNTKIIKKTNKKDFCGDSISEQSNSKQPPFDPISVKPNNLTLEEWTEWVNYRKKKKSMLPESWIAQSEMLEAQSNPYSIIKKSITGGWTGLFPDKSNQLIKPEPEQIKPDNWIDNLEDEFFDKDGRGFL